MKWKILHWSVELPVESANELEAETATISCEDGILLVIESRD